MSAAKKARTNSGNTVPGPANSYEVNGLPVRAKYSGCRNAKVVVKKPKEPAEGEEEPPKFDDHKLKIVSFYNHKGGVGKTTSLYSTAFELIEKGERVLMVDADPQRNLTQFCLHYSVQNHDALYPSNGPLHPPESFSNFCTKMGNTDTIYTAVEPCIDTNDDSEFVENEVLVPKLWQFESFGDLFLLAGDERIQDLDDKISGMSRMTSQDVMIAQQAKLVFGMTYHAIKQIAHHHDITTVLIDLSPSAGVFNRNVLLSSHYFVVPGSADYFSEEAINSLIHYFPRWVGTAAEIAEPISFLSYWRLFHWSQDTKYRLPRDPDSPSSQPVPRLPKFLGLMMSRIGYRGGGMAGSYNILQFVRSVQEKVGNLITRFERDPSQDSRVADLRQMSMDHTHRCYYATIQRHGLHKDDGMKGDVNVGTISIVKEFHQLSYISQRLSLPVAFLRVDSPDFLHFDEKKAAAYDASVESASRSGLERPPPMPLRDLLKNYSPSEKTQLATMIQRAHWPFERAAAYIKWAKADV